MCAQLERGRNGRQQRGTVRAQAVGGTGSDERLEHAAVEPLLIQPAAQVEQTGKGPVRLPFGHQALDHATADTLDRAEPVSNGAFPGDDEFVLRAVEVRSLHFDSE